MITEKYISHLPVETFEVGERIATGLSGGDAVLLFGGLGAGKTLLTKGILSGFGFDVDEVTSPSFTLVNLYQTETLDIYHIDLWRLDGGQDIAAAVGLDDIFDNERAAVIIEWAERLGPYPFPHNVVNVRIDGDGEDPRAITVEQINLTRL